VSHPITSLDHVVCDESNALRWDGAASSDGKLRSSSRGSLPFRYSLVHTGAVALILLSAAPSTLALTTTLIQTSSRRGTFFPSASCLASLSSIAVSRANKCERSATTEWLTLSYTSNAADAISPSMLDTESSYSPTIPRRPSARHISTPIHASPITAEAVERTLRSLSSSGTLSAPGVVRAAPPPIPLDGVLATKAADSVARFHRTRAIRRASRLPGAPPGGATTADVEDSVAALVISGLTPFDVASVLVHTPSLATGWREDEGGGTMGLLTETMGLRRYDARKVIRSCPGILTKEGSMRAVDTIDLLHAGLGLSMSSLVSDRGNVLPSLLCRKASDIFRLVAFLTSEDVGMHIGRAVPMLRRRETVGLLDVVAAAPYGRVSQAWRTDKGYLRPRPVVQAELEVERAFSNMRKTSQTLRNLLGEEDFHQIIISYPDALLLSPNEQIIPVVDFLHSEVGLPAEIITSIIRSYPSLLGITVADMSHRISYLASLGVNGDDIRRIVRAFPSILALDVDTKMVPVVEFLRAIRIDNVGRFISRLPAILGYSVHEELIPKWNYLTKTCGYSYFEIYRFPACFSYPLDKVMATRHEYLIMKNISLGSLQGLDELLRSGDRDFAVKVAGDVDGGDRYLRFCKSRANFRKSGAKQLVGGKSGAKQLVGGK